MFWVTCRVYHHYPKSQSDPLLHSFVATFSHQPPTISLASPRCRRSLRCRHSWCVWGWWSAGDVGLISFKKADNGKKEDVRDYLLGMYCGNESLIIIRGWQGLPSAKTTLLKNYTSSGKSFVFVDRRIGDEELGECDKKIMSRVVERMRADTEIERYNHINLLVCGA
nr:hypothetical protein [Tanacetum cinerariifolium]